MTEHAALRAALADFVPIVLDATGTPGIALAVATRDGAVLTEGYGLADIARRRPMTAATPSRLGSMSKLYVACAVLQLVDDDRLDLYAPIERYLKYRVTNPLGSTPVTPYHLLTHTSGLRTDTYAVSFQEPVPLGEYLDATYRADRGHEYGGVGRLWTARVAERYQYSNLGMATLADAVANIAGVPWHRYAAEHLFAPLGMNDAAFPPDAPRTAPSTGYARYGSLHIPSPVLHSQVHPATGLVGTVRDHAAWLSMILADGLSPSGARVLSSASVRAMLAPHAAVARPDVSDRPTVGLGIETNRRGSLTGYYGHGGAYPLGWWGDSRAYPRLGHGGVVIVAAENHWDITRFVNPNARTGMGIVADYVADWFAGRRTVPSTPTDSAPERASHAAGLLFYERLAALLGAGHLPDAVMDAARGGLTGPQVDAAAFGAGMNVLRDTNLSPPEIRAACAALGLPQLAVEALRAGASRAEWPVPMSYHADRREESRSDGSAHE